MKFVSERKKKSPQKDNKLLAEEKSFTRPMGLREVGNKRKPEGQEKGLALFTPHEGRGANASKKGVSWTLKWGNQNVNRKKKEADADETNGGDISKNLKRKKKKKPRGWRL